MTLRVITQPEPEYHLIEFKIIMSCAVRIRVVHVNHCRRRASYRYPLKTVIELKLNINNRRILFFFLDFGTKSM